MSVSSHSSEYERSFTVWRAVIGILHLIRSLTWDIEEVANLLDNFCQRILRPFLDELGLRSQLNEAGHDRQCRASLIGYLASLRDTEIQSAAKEMFNNHVNGNQPLVAGKHCNKGRGGGSGCARCVSAHPLLGHLQFS